MSPTPVAERELTLTRLLDAPRDLVWKAWTDPVELAKWWGPKDFTNPVCEFDARPGGKILIHMQGPEGPPYPMTGEVLEVDPIDRLVLKTFALDGDGNPLLEGATTINFADREGMTELTVHSRAVGFFEYTKPMLEGMEVGWSQSLEKLDDLVSK